MRRLIWTNLVALVAVHILGVYGLIRLAFFEFSWATLILAVSWYACCGLAITGGYHRLFSHRSYAAAWPLRLFYLLFGAGAAQNSALKWSIDHRNHHTHTDRSRDPYNINRGFWWAHIRWIYIRGISQNGAQGADLTADPLVRFQDRHYLLLAALFGALIPAAIGSLWGDALGGLLVAGFLRLTFQWHATFSVNSVAHWIGNRPYSKATTARDSFITALISLGEGYHNFHHRFQADYRNGIRWYHFDPTKWFVWTMQWARITKALKRTPSRVIAEAKRKVLASSQRAFTPQ